MIDCIHVNDEGTVIYAHSPNAYNCVRATIKQLEAQKSNCEPDNANN
jgi:hypothetical protein